MNEHVFVPVRVAGNEIGRDAQERHATAVGGDHGVGARKIPLHSAGVDADELGRVEEAVAYEDVVEAVRISGDEIGRRARERHVAAVRGDRGVRAVAVPLCPGRIDADALGRPGLAVADEHVDRVVRVPGDEVGRRARESHVAAVAGDRQAGRAAVTVALDAGRIDADALGRAGLAVVDEDVDRSVRVARDQVGGGAVERHVPAVRLSPGRVDADPRDRAEHAVADEDVHGVVRVAGSKGVGIARERHAAAVGRDRRVVATPAALRASRVDTRALGRAALPISDEDVRRRVQVAGKEIARVAHEHHGAAVGGEREAVEAAEAVPLDTGRAHARAQSDLCGNRRGEGRRADRPGAERRDGSKPCCSRFHGSDLQLPQDLAQTSIRASHRARCDRFYRSEEFSGAARGTSRPGIGLPRRRSAFRGRGRAWRVG